MQVQLVGEVHWQVSGRDVKMAVLLSLRIKVYFGLISSYTSIMFLIFRLALLAVTKLMPYHG